MGEKVGWENLDLRGIYKEAFGMIHIYEIDYQIEDDTRPDYLIGYKAEVGAHSAKEAKAIFNRHHAAKDRVVKVSMKRFYGNRKEQKK